MTVAMDWLTFFIALATLLGVLLGWFRIVLPRYRNWRSQFIAARDSIIGRPAIVETTTGREIEPALPGVGVRLANQEKHLGVLADAVASLAQTHLRVDDHEKRIAALEVASVERIVSRAESAAGWRAMEAAALATPDPVVEPDDD